MRHQVLHLEMICCCKRTMGQSWFRLQDRSQQVCLVYLSSVKSTSPLQGCVVSSVTWTHRPAEPDSPVCWRQHVRRWGPIIASSFINIVMNICFSMNENRRNIWRSDFIKLCESESIRLQSRPEELVQFQVLVQFMKRVQKNIWRFIWRRQDDRNKHILAGFHIQSMMTDIFRGRLPTQMMSHWHIQPSSTAGTAQPITVHFNFCKFWDCCTF